MAPEINLMHHPNSLEVTQSALLIIDMQEAFRSKVADFQEVAERIAIMVQAAKLLKIPTLVSEQYPKGLGHTATEIKEQLADDAPIIEKTAFSSCGAPTFGIELGNTKARQLLVCGIEAHICVNQTTHDLLASGFQVHLIADCITSRQQASKKVALKKMQMSGAIISSVEMALFELLRDAKHEQFKAVQGLIK